MSLSWTRSSGARNRRRKVRYSEIDGERGERGKMHCIPGLEQWIDVHIICVARVVAVALLRSERIDGCARVTLALTNLSIGLVRIGFPRESNRHNFFFSRLVPVRKCAKCESSFQSSCPFDQTNTLLFCPVFSSAFRIIFFSRSIS